MDFNTIQNRINEIVETEAMLTAEKQELRQEVIAHIQELIYTFGVQEKELNFNGKKAAARARTSEARYKDPVSGSTWTGRGRKPQWVADHLAKGGKLEDFSIQSAE